MVFPIRRPGKGKPYNTYCPHILQVVVQREVDNPLSQVFMQKSYGVGIGLREHV